MAKNPKRTLGVFSLTMMIVLSVDSIRNFPANALFGQSIIFFFTIAAILFLIPNIKKLDDGQIFVIYYS